MSDVDRRVAPVPSTSPRSAVTNPGATNPGATNPGATNPGATNPGATDAETTYPGYSSARATSLIWAEGLRKSYPATGSGRGGEPAAACGIHPHLRPGKALRLLGPKGA